MSTCVAPTTPRPPFHGGLAHSTQTTHNCPRTIPYLTPNAMHRSVPAHDTAPSCHHALFYLCQRNHGTLAPCRPYTTHHSVPASWRTPSTSWRRPTRTLSSPSPAHGAICIMRCVWSFRTSLRKDWPPPFRLPKRGPVTSLQTHRRQLESGLGNFGINLMAR